MLMRLATFALAAAASVAGLSSAHAFEASFSWKGVAACSGGSPAFTIKGAPAGTAQLRFGLKDLNAIDFPHGGSTVAYAGKGTVPAGAINYRAPCPPAGEHHKYVWTIESLDASGKVLGKTQVSGVYPPQG
jgi:phosphatidylethanolamine-binding protein (PEBP) family uncharacterized protein